MKLVSSPSLEYLNSLSDDVHKLFLYGSSPNKDIFSCGSAIKKYIEKEKLQPNNFAWDFMSLALTVLTADFVEPRNKSSDGWTREIQIDIAVSNTEKWSAQKEIIEQMLNYLTTDIWQVNFSPNGYIHDIDSGVEEHQIDADSTTLLSGGMDSLIGLIDLHHEGKRPLVISQIVTGDRLKQIDFVNKVDSTLKHIQLNHNILCRRSEKSTRSRSIIFLAYGILLGTCLKKYKNGENVIQYICENVLISLNIPLTSTRIGSLSTRTTNPIYLNLLQKLLNNLDIKIIIKNPYQFKTKGEMCVSCTNQVLLKKIIKDSTSCGRFARYNFTQCGRCFPCLIRRASFKKWDQLDKTEYYYKDLRKKDRHHAGFDDVRSAAMAIIESEERGLDFWIGPSLSNPIFTQEKSEYENTVKRGLEELKKLLKYYRVL